MTTHTPATDAHSLLDPEVFAAVVATVQGNNPGMVTATAGRIVNEALAFVATAARLPHTYISPSRTVDEGWHALILHTAVYAGLCEQLGCFVHHYPERPDPSRHDDQVMERTLTLIRESGYQPDLSLWMPPTDQRIPVAADCSHTPKPGGCGPINPGNCASHCSGGGE